MSTQNIVIAIVVAVIVVGGGYYLFGLDNAVEAPATTETAPSNN